MRVFLDANILFSASFEGSHLALFLQELGHHAVLLTNDFAKEEALRNITAKQPGRIAKFEAVIAEIGTVPFHLFDIEVPLATKDHPILCGAIASKSNFLLTGDKRDFGHLFGKTVCGVKVVTVELLLAHLIARGLVSGS